MQGLIRTALKQNYDLELATERINAARAELAVTRSNLFPQLSGDAISTEEESKPSNQVQLSVSRGGRHISTDFFGDFAALQKRRGPNSWRPKRPNMLSR